MNFSSVNYFDKIAHHLCFHSIEFDWNINFDNITYLYMSSLYYDRWRLLSRKNSCESICFFFENSASIGVTLSQQYWTSTCTCTVCFYKLCIFSFRRYLLRIRLHLCLNWLCFLTHTSFKCNINKRFFFVRYYLQYFLYFKTWQQQRENYVASIGIIHRLKPYERSRGSHARFTF